MLEPLFEFDVNIEPVLFLATEWPTVETGLLDPQGVQRNTFHAKPCGTPVCISGIDGDTTDA